eukprot:TRINITY_DN32022_c0_g1_i1.p1 TRINITY_DN32022_c0_g1~~TRINITY_DN32022_c0_g1_i1.p1  ORF type:complete len:815 (+),score=295.13 TRINITY_DN32022_c0_g1_i1:154-2598(+)
MPDPASAIQPSVIQVARKMSGGGTAYAPGSTEPDTEAAGGMEKKKSFKSRVQRAGLVSAEPKETEVSTEATRLDQLAKWALAEITTEDDDEVKMEKLYRVLQIQVNKGFILRELIPYLVFLTMMLSVMFVSRTEFNEASVHRLVEGVRGSILSTGFRNTDDMRFLKTFWDISYDGEWWDWLESPLAATLWPGKTPQNPYGLFNSYLKPVRYVVLRQQRVDRSACDKAEAYDLLPSLVQATLPMSCYAEYDCNHVTCNVDESPYGPNGTFRSLSEVDNGLTLNRVDGQLHDYSFPSRSFVHVLNVDEQDLSAVLAEVRQLRRDGWVDNATRFLGVDVIALDRNLDVFVWASFFCEITAGGLWIPQARMVPYQFMRFKTGGAIVIFVLDIFITAFFCYVLYRLIQGIFRHYALHREIIGYFRFWNTYTITDMVLFGVTYGYRWSFWHLTISADSSGETERDALETWSTLASYAYHYETSWNVYGFAATLALGGLVRFIQYNPRMNMVFETIERALGELLVVVFLLILDVFAFGLLGNLLFGYYIDEFQSFFASCGTLMRMLIGDFPDNMYYSMRDAQMNTAAAAIFLLFYFLTAWLVLLNLVIGVLAEAFASVKDKVGTTDFDFFAAVQSYASILSGKCCPTQDQRAENQRRKTLKQQNKAQAEVIAKRRTNVYGKLKAYKKSGYWRDRLKKKELLDLQLDPANGNVTFDADDAAFLNEMLLQHVHEVCDRAVQSEEQEMLKKIYAVCMQLLATAQTQGSPARSGSEAGPASLLAKLRRERPSQAAPPAPGPTSPTSGLSAASDPAPVPNSVNTTE